MGAEYPIAQSMLSELIPSSHRGRYLALLEGFWPLVLSVPESLPG